MVQSKNFHVKVQRKKKRAEARGTRKEEERRKERQRGEEEKKRNGSERSAFAVERPRGRDRRQKHRRLTSARNHSRADPGKIRSPIVYILKYARAGMHLGAR